MSKLKGSQVSGSEFPPFYIYYEKKNGKYRLYQKKEDGTWSDSIGKSKEGYNGLVELQNRAKKKQQNYIKELQSKAKTPEETKPTPEEKGLETIKDATNAQVDLTANKADEEQVFSDRMNQIIAQSRQTGQDPFEILLTMNDEKDEQGNPILPAHIFNRLYSSIEGRKKNQSLEEIIRKGTDDRRKSFQEYKNLPEDRKELEQSTVSALLNPGTGLTDYQQIASGLSEEEQENLTPDLLHMLQGKKKLQNFSNTADASSKKIGAFEPGKEPTYADAENLYFQRLSPNHVYSSDAKFNEIGHGLAIAGHAGGSSSLENNENAAGRIRYQEDLEGIERIHRMLQRDHESRGVSIDQAKKIQEGVLGPLKSSIELDENMHGKQSDRDLEKFKTDADLQRRITEGGMNLATQEMGEGIDLKNVESGQLSAEAQTLQNTNNMIYNYLMQVEELKKSGALGDQAFRNTESQIWERRQNVLIALERLAQTDREMQQKVEALKDANKRADKQAFMQILGTVGTVALATAFGGPGAGLMALTGSNLGLKTQETSFGRSVNNWLGGGND